jgi:BMFP domain-containing protein YqiC
VLADIIDQIAKTTARAMPAGMTQEVERNLRGALQAAFDGLDLVTREELEVQEAVLARTRARLEVMEKRVADLEARLGKK